MIICQTPFRVSFFGGGTDYPSWYLENGGSVLSTAINKYGYISCRYLPPFFDFKHRIVYSKIELAKSTTEIIHPAVKAVLQYLDVQEGLEIHYDGDIPSQSGIGSSSSFTVGLLNTIYALRGRMTTKKMLAEQAIHVEQNIIGETVGSQDQVAAAYGGLNRINFHQNGTFEVHPVIISPERSETLQSHMIMFFTGFSRIAAQIAQSKIQNFAAKKAHLMRMHQMVDDAQGILQSNSTPISEIGTLLDEAWHLKRDLSDKVSTSMIDQIYETGIQAGATGGKLLGAGGGGFMLFVAPPEEHDSIRSALKNLVEVPIEFDYSGSQIILFNPEMATTRTPLRLVQKIEKKVAS